MPQPIISFDQQATGPAGTAVTVKGVDFGALPVELRWNALDGPRMGDAIGPVFTTRITIPEASPGLYTLVAFGRAVDGSATARASVAFEVTGTTSGTASPIRPDDARGHLSQGGGGNSVLRWSGLALVTLVIASVGGFIGARFSQSRAPRSTSTAEV